MNKFAIAFVAATSLFTLGACKKGGGSAMLEKYSEYVKKVCECKDQGCVTKLTEEWGKAAAAMAGDAAKTDPKEAAAMMEKMKPETEKMTKCVTDIAAKAAGGGGGGGGAAGGGSAEPAGGGGGGGGEMKKDEPAGSAEPKKEEDKKEEGK
jgi:hypothetical protein